MVITLVVVVVLLVVAAGVIGFILERRRGDHDLPARQKRHAELDIRPLDPDRVRDYRSDWEMAQTRFVDDPRGAIGDADMLIEALMSERGYPVGDFDTKVADLSVQHADVLQHYRAAHQIATASAKGDADTESLRRAMVHYRALFAALLDDGVQAHREEQTSRRAR